MVMWLRPGLLILADVRELIRTLLDLTRIRRRVAGRSIIMSGLVRKMSMKLSPRTLVYVFVLLCTLRIDVILLLRDGLTVLFLRMLLFRSM